jgi:PAS domain-containing protein
MPAEVVLHGFSGATFGVRRTENGLDFLALSSWQTIDAISAATAGPPDAMLPGRGHEGTLEALTVDLFEAADEPFELAGGGGGALGIVWGTVAQHAEGRAHEMIRAVTPEVGLAGVADLKVGRRVVGDRTELLVVAVWRDRLALHQFAMARRGATLDPEFLELMSDWRFETYDSLAPGSSLIPAPGPAILLIDGEGRCLDASPGVEGVLGLPAELILRRTFAEFCSADGLESWQDGRTALRDRGAQSGQLEIDHPDGRQVIVGYRAEADCPIPGIEAWILGPSGGAPDPRPVADVVSSVFPAVLSAVA